MKLVTPENATDWELNPAIVDITWTSNEVGNCLVVGLLSLSKAMVDITWTSNEVGNSALRPPLASLLSSLTSHGLLMKLVTFSLFTP